MRINHRSAKDHTREIVKDNATLVGEIANFFDFADVISASDSLTPLAGFSLVGKVISSSISASLLLSKHIIKSKIAHDADLTNADKFTTLFYITSIRIYFETVLEGLEILKKGKQDSGSKISAETLQKVKAEIINCQKDYEQVDIDILFCLDPSKGVQPLYDSLTKWFSTSLKLHNFDASLIHGASETIRTEARLRFELYISGPTEEANWIRNYLLISDLNTSKKIFESLDSINKALEKWKEGTPSQRKKREVEWVRYKSELKELPDQKDSMFNEEFGVRSVFIQPLTKYYIAGETLKEGEDNTITDLGMLLGALTSSRIGNQDLIIVSGGPGSGKSTLCRVLASELAKLDDVFPVFLKLRRLKEGAEIASFVEETLQKNGVISRLADLRGLKNLILILDGFDELVMASRSRLRHFFNILKEENFSGPLKNAKIIVSGRDTLFPNGEGLPIGSHIISLLPFDEERIKAWGDKWKQIHKSGHGKTFKPELLADHKKDSKKSSLFHLISWPLTLHLVARVHTSGKLDLSGSIDKKIDKAYLYRSILSETAKRQQEQASGIGRLSSTDMRKFLRSLAWAMYIRSTDSMDPDDVIPIISSYFKDSSNEISELADVAIVNSPELTKGEETGFEFVHKSFGEYLVAEHLADSIERVTYQVKDYDSENLTWRLSSSEAMSSLAKVLSVRLLPEEIQEMMEPMLGAFLDFQKGDRVDQSVRIDLQKDGLFRTQIRFQQLYNDLISGKNLDLIEKEIVSAIVATNSLEAVANQCAGLLFIGSFATRQLRILREENCNFNLEVFPGAFWKAYCLINVGGVYINRNLASRLFDGLSASVIESENPIKLRHISNITGLNRDVTNSLKVVTANLYEFMRRSFLYQLVFQMESLEEFRMPRFRISRELLNQFETFRRAGIDVDEEMLENIERIGHEMDYFIENLYTEMKEGKFEIKDRRKYVLKILEDILKKNERQTFPLFRYESKMRFTEEDFYHKLKRYLRLTSGG